MQIRIRSDEETQPFPELHHHLSIEAKRAERIMTALAAIIDDVETPPLSSLISGVKENVVTSEVVAALYDHARNPDIKLEPRFVRAISRMNGGVISGGEICRLLFGNDCHAKLAAEQEVAIESPDVRAMLIAARPKVKGEVERAFLRGKDELVQEAVSAVLEAISESNIESHAATSQIVALFNDHAQHPEHRISADMVETLERIHTASLNGIEICQRLFGESYRERLEEVGSLSMAPDVCGVLKRLAPRVQVNIRHPLDLTDASTRAHEESTRRHLQIVQQRREVTSEAGDGYTPIPHRAGEEWRDHIRPSSSIAVRSLMHAQRREAVRE